jgi:hypothetical protein
MSMQADQLQTIGLIAAHEAAIAELYSAYAAKFPASSDLFSQLAAAERDHARHITDFATAVRTGKVHIRTDRFAPAAFLNSLDFIREQVQEAPNPDVSLLKALSIAYDLENGLIERRYFEVVEGDPEELRDLLQRLEAETSEHRDLVRVAWDKERQHSP